MPSNTSGTWMKTLSLKKRSLVLTLIAFTGMPAAGACPASKGFFVRPLEGNISRGFGMTLEPLTGVMVMHTGIDIDAPTGRPVRAAEGGTVVAIKTKGAFGKAVRVNHGGGFASIYAHLSRIDVSEGDCVDIGGQLGAAGDTGISSHPTLHFEIIENGRAIDPLRVLQSNK